MPVIIQNCSGCLSSLQQVDHKKTTILAKILKCQWIRRQILCDCRENHENQN